MQTVVPFEVPALQVRQGAGYRCAKRLIDVVGAALLLLLLLPVLGICALLIRWGSPGPIIFRQERVGLGGRTFTCLKFRSMRAEADPALHRRYVAVFIQGQTGQGQDAQGQDAQGQDARGPLFKLARDPRITPLGHFLRRTSLDELPQLWNVLRGDMSLVGPRPPIPYELEHYRPEHLRRLAVRPGLTGLWQVSGRSRTTFDEMVALDLAYIRRASLLLDLHILVRTLPVVLGYSAAR